MDPKQTNDEIKFERDRRVPNMYNYLRSYCSFVQTFSLALNPFHLSFSSLGLSLFFFFAHLTRSCCLFLPQTNPFFAQDTLLPFVFSAQHISSHSLQHTSRQHKTSAPSFPRLFFRLRHEPKSGAIYPARIVIKDSYSRLLSGNALQVQISEELRIWH